MIKLSVVIITLNEERNIGRCLESLRGVADEIIVVDSGSTDQTEAICKKYDAKIIFNRFEGHIQQKNFALGFCTHDHIFSIDADESLSSELKNSIVNLKNNWEKDGYYFNRLTNYCGKWIRHSGWYPDRKLRLFKKGSGKWAGSNPHDQFMLASSGSQGFLSGNLLHYSYYTIEDHIRQADKFANIAAESAYREGKRSSIVQIIVRPAIRFVRDYLLRLGILDGYFGLVICKISAHAAFIKYVKLFELQKKKGL